MRRRDLPENEIDAMMALNRSWRGKGRKTRSLPQCLCILAAVLALAVGSLPGSSPPALAENKSRQSFKYVENGQASTELHLPVYEWLPEDGKPKGLVLAIHGLTLHGTSYELLGRSFAVAGYYVAAPDMRGFGLCRKDEAHRFCVGADCKSKVDYNKSFDDIAGLARWMRSKYPALPLIVIGESLGATMAVRLASLHPECVSALILSGPAVRINPLMFFHPQSIWAGFYGLMISPRFSVNLHGFINNLVSDDPSIKSEMMSDPLVAKTLNISELLKSESFVGKTLSYARGIARDTPILIIQGSKDRCVTPGAIVKLTEQVSSSDQTMRWLGHHGHLLLETHFIRAATIRAVTDWMDDHSPLRESEMKQVEKEIQELGGKSATQD